MQSREGTTEQRPGFQSRSGGTQEISCIQSAKELLGSLIILL